MKTLKKMNEKSIERKLRQEIKKIGGLALKIWCTTLSGFPDRIVLLPGAQLHFVEVKTTGKKPTKIQLHLHAVLQKMGFQVWVIDSEISLRKFLTDIEK